jgi:hypothetical protein
VRNDRSLCPRIAASASLSASRKGIKPPKEYSFLRIE